MKTSSTKSSLSKNHNKRGSKSCRISGFVQLAVAGVLSASQLVHAQTCTPPTGSVSAN